jgi:hypothetical protein
MLAMGTEVEVLHVDKVIFNVYDLVLLIGLLCAICIYALDVIDTWQCRIILKVRVQELRVACNVADLIVINDTDASFSSLDRILVRTVLAIIQEILLGIQVDV